MPSDAIKSIIVPLDGSSLAERALPLAVAIAERNGAALRLVRVLPHDLEDVELTNITTDLDDAAQRVGTSCTSVVRYGAPADEILAEASTLVSPLIVMTTHGRSGVGRWVLGGVADRVVRGGEAPVLLVRSDMPNTPAPLTIRRIMVPLDGSKFGEAALPIAEVFARSVDADMRLVRVAETGHLTATFDTTLFPLPSGFIQQLAHDLIIAAASYLSDVSSRLTDQGLRAYPVNLQGFPSEQLLEHERDAAIDLVIMATHARGGPGRMIYGGVAEKLLQLGQCPILVVHPVAV